MNASSNTMAAMEKVDIDINEKPVKSKMRVECMVCGQDFKTRHDLKRHDAGPQVNHAYPRAFDARASFVNDARILAQDSRALNAHFTRI